MRWKLFSTFSQEFHCVVLAVTLTDLTTAVCCQTSKQGRLRVVSNFGDSDHGRAKIHTRACKIPGRHNTKGVPNVSAPLIFGACIVSPWNFACAHVYFYPPPPQSLSPKLDTSCSLQLSWLIWYLI